MLGAVFIAGAKLRKEMLLVTGCLLWADDRDAIPKQALSITHIHIY